MKRWGIIVGMAMAVGIPLLWFVMSADHGNAIGADHSALRADGFSRAEIRLKPLSGDGGRCTYEVQAAPGVAQLLQVRHEKGRDVVVLQAGVVSGHVKLVSKPPVTDGDASQVVAELQINPDWRDENGNGFPDSLELQSTSDRRAFLDWFRYLAEEQLYRGEGINPEVNDCAALLRFAYREALRKHDGEWATRVGMQTVRPLPDVQRYQYPFTPLKADLFRLWPGPFQPADLAAGRFGQFADAENLLLHNATRIGKEIHHAQPGDLLFYRQEGQGMPFHAMLFLGASMVEPEDSGAYVLYHTGPDGSWPGEMRRRTVEEMLRHPEARWHPVTTNPAFLGVYRWKIVGAGGGG